MIRRDIEENFENKRFSLDKNHPAYEARLAYLERKKAEDLDAVNSFEKKAKAKKRKSKLSKKKLLLVQTQERLKWS